MRTCIAGGQAVIQFGAESSTGLSDTMNKRCHGRIGDKIAVGKMYGHAVKFNGKQSTNRLRADIRRFNHEVVFLGIKSMSSRFTSGNHDIVFSRASCLILRVCGRGRSVRGMRGVRGVSGRNRMENRGDHEQDKNRRSRKRKQTAQTCSPKSKAGCFVHVVPEKHG